VPKGGKLVPSTTTIAPASTLELCGGSTHNPSRTTKSATNGDLPTSKGPSLSGEVQPEIFLQTVNHVAFENSEVSTQVEETHSVLEGSHMRGQRITGRGSTSKNRGAVMREEIQAKTNLSAQENDSDHNEDGHEFKDEVGDEASESDDKGGEEENKVSGEEEVKLDETVNRKRRKPAKGGPERKSKVNPRVSTGRNSKRKKLLVESQKSTTSNTRVAAKTKK